MNQLLPDHRELLAIWTSKQAGACPPLRCAFAVEDLISYLPHLAFLQLDFLLSALRVETVGARFVDLIGRDWTGAPLANVLHPTERAGTERVFSAALEGAPQIMRAASVRPEAAPFVLEWLILPCADPTGAVTRLIVSILPRADLSVVPRSRDGAKP
ncbi:MAG: PAS domain-containing protein [Caulobacterales bacterium]|jgi:hypothetical protein